MKEISFWAGELLFATVWLAARIAVWLSQGKIDWHREAKLLLMFVNLVVIIRVAFYPMARLNGRVQPLFFDPDTVYPFRVNLTPLVHLLEYKSRKEMLLTVIGNFALFIPSGIILPILYPKLDRFWKVVTAGALLSLCIEIIQLPFSVRASDVDDLILNTLGVMAGYGIYAAVRAMKKK